MSAARRCCRTANWCTASRHVGPGSRSASWLRWLTAPGTGVWDSFADSLAKSGNVRPENTLSFTSFWRRGAGSNRRIKVLQTSALPLGYRASQVGSLRNIAHRTALSTPNAVRSLIDSPRETLPRPVLSHSPDFLNERANPSSRDLSSDRRTPCNGGPLLANSAQSGYISPQRGRPYGAHQTD